MLTQPRRAKPYPVQKLGLSLAFLTATASAGPALAQTASLIGKEISTPVHLQDGKEQETSISDLIAFGEKLFSARWTSQEGQGRPLTKGTGSPLAEPSSPLVFPRNFDRISGPDSNSCAGCHNTPFVGGGGDRVSEVFVLGQRFDFITFDHSDTVPTADAMDESGTMVTMENAFNERKTIGMNGSGFIEMLARQMTADLQAHRDAIPAGASAALSTKGISFGTLVHNSDGSWNTSKVQGIPAPSLVSSKTSLPSLIIRPFHQVGNVIRSASLRTMRSTIITASSPRNASGLGPTTMATASPTSLPPPILLPRHCFRSR